MGGGFFLRFEWTFTLVPGRCGRWQPALLCSAAFTCMRPAELCALGLRLTIAGALDATSRRRSSMACLQGVQVVRLSLRCLVAPGSWCRRIEDGRHLLFEVAAKDELSARARFVWSLGDSSAALLS